MTDLQLDLLIAPVVLFAVLGGGTYVFLKIMDRQQDRAQ
jgi:hypothetical protein